MWEVPFTEGEACPAYPVVADGNRMAVPGPGGRERKKWSAVKSEACRKVFVQLGTPHPLRLCSWDSRTSWISFWEKQVFKPEFYPLKKKKCFSIANYHCQRILSVKLMNKFSMSIRAEMRWLLSIHIYQIVIKHLLCVRQHTKSLGDISEQDNLCFHGYAF